MKVPLLGIFVLLLAVGRVQADAVIMRDGSVRWGTMIARSAAAIQFRTHQDGMTVVTVIPVPQIARVIVGARPPAHTPTIVTAATAPATAAAPSAAVAASAPANVVPPASAPPTALSPAPLVESPVTPSASDAELAAYASRGFLPELLATALGHGPADLGRLPASDRQLWDAAATADKADHPAETLEALRRLEAAMHDLPDGLARLDAISRTQRDEPFGTWMARVHWSLIGGKYSTGQFDLADVRDVERPPLIALLRKATAPALEPLKPYFPPIDDKTGKPLAFRPAQLAGITAANALDIKDKALLAAALLTGQLRLEPDMPAIDRNVFYAQMANANHVLSRARDLEPAAKAALARAQQEQRAAEEKVRRDAALAAQRSTNRPK